MRSSRKTFFAALRLALGVGLLAILARSMDLDELGALLRRIAPAWLIPAGLVILLLRVVMAARWKSLLHAFAIHVSLLELVRVLFISMFMGYFLPGAIGMDVVRGYFLMKKHSRKVDIAATVLLDRLVGVYALSLFAFVGSLAAVEVENRRVLIVSLALLQLLLLGAGIVFLRLGSRLRRTPAGGRAGWRASLRAQLVRLSGLIEHPRMAKAGSWLLLLSLLAMLGRCILFYCLYRAFGVDLSIGPFLVFIPLVMVAIMIPITAGGLGIREGALVYFFGLLGVATEVSASVGILSHILQIVVGIPGLYFWFVGDRTTLGRSTSPQVDRGGGRPAHGS